MSVRRTIAVPVRAVPDSNDGRVAAGVSDEKKRELEDELRRVLEAVPEDHGIHGEGVVSARAGAADGSPGAPSAPPDASCPRRAAAEL